MSNVRPDSTDVDLASRYDRVSNPQFTHGRDLIELLALKPRDWILDIGCGTGRLAAFAVTRLGPEGRIVGIDPTSSRIEIGKRSRDKRLEFRVGRAEDLSAFAAAQFEVVYMNSVLNWLGDKPRALAEAHRVLNPGGRFGIATTIRDRPNELWGIVRQARDVASGLAEDEVAARAKQREAKRYLSVEEVRQLLQLAGFRARVAEMRTYVSSFDDVSAIMEFIRASTDDNMVAGSDGEYVVRFRMALERFILQMLPEPRRRNGIQFERYVLLAVADKSA